MADGYSRAGDALGTLLGGGAQTKGVYEKTLKQAYDVEQALQDARRARSLAIIEAGRETSRAAVTPDLLQAALGGDITAQATLGASVLGGNHTMNLGQLGEYQRPHYGQNVNLAQDALEAGRIADYNKFNAAAAGKSYQPVQVLGGAYVPDGMTIDTIDAVPTPEVLSRIEKNEVLGQAAMTRANRAPAPKAPKPPSTASMEADVLAQARAAIAQGASKEAVKARLIDRGYSKLAAKL